MLYACIPMVYKIFVCICLQHATYVHTYMYIHTHMHIMAEGRTQQLWLWWFMDLAVEFSGLLVAAPVAFADLLVAAVDSFVAFAVPPVAPVD
jgi:hypothetical protein